jgi:adenosylcobinamide-phosphate synthase
MSILLTFMALLFEWAIGYPNWLFRAIGHPVSWIGRPIAYLDRALNRPERSERLRRLAGIATLIVLIVISGGTGWLVQSSVGEGIGIVLTALLASSLLAQRSLASHVEAVATALEEGGLEAGREAVSQIVGRDPASLDEAGVARAAIESLAENYSDGVVAPTFWMAVAGLPGAAIYKAVNTADSMIGHKTERHAAFGWAAARFDDLINLPASRLSAFFIICGAMTLPGASPCRAIAAVRRDAHRHNSPNAGWPEAAMAGALGLALAGPRIYSGVLTEAAVMGEGGRPEANAADIRHALSLYRRAVALMIAAVGLAAAVILIT